VLAWLWTLAQRTLSELSPRTIARPLYPPQAAPCGSHPCHALPPTCSTGRLRDVQPGGNAKFQGFVVFAHTDAPSLLPNGVGIQRKVRVWLVGLSGLPLAGILGVKFAPW
jgi:hypothetical protein